ncbi:MAG: carboxypeptidase regulatory-like domain-containing protein [Gemmatimonadales bacterium]
MTAGVPATVLLLVLLAGVQVDELPPARHVTIQQSDSTLGSVEGFVRLAGQETPSPTTVENSTDPEVCGRLHSLDDLVISHESRAVRYVIAALVDVPKDRVPAHVPSRLVLDNRDCRFEPHVAAVVVGDTVTTTNGDPILHTTHFYGALRGNISLSASGMIVSRVARSPGMVTTLCDVHGWMKAFIRVDEHPYHAVTDETGYFHISEIPPGSYTLELWHEKLGARKVAVRIEPGITSRIDIEYALSRNKPL